MFETADPAWMSETASKLLEFGLPWGLETSKRCASSNGKDSCQGACPRKSAWWEWPFHLYSLRESMFRNVSSLRIHPTLQMTQRTWYLTSSLSLIWKFMNLGLYKNKFVKWSKSVLTINIKTLKLCLLNYLDIKDLLVARNKADFGRLVWSRLS